MSFELTIKADNPADFLKSVAGIYGAMFAGRVAAPAPVEAPAPAVAEQPASVAETAEAPAPEKVDPPKKPRGRPPKSAEPVDLKANLKANLEQSIAETPAPAPAANPAQLDIEDAIAAAPIDRDTVRQKLLQYLDDIRVAIGDEAMRPALAKVFKRLTPPISEMKVKAVPDERLGELDAAIDAEKAARSAPEV